METCNGSLTTTYFLSNPMWTVRFREYSEIYCPLPFDITKKLRYNTTKELRYVIELEDNKRELMELSKRIESMGESL